MKKTLFILIFLSKTCIAQVNLNQGLIAYYPFNGNTNNAVGNTLNGIAQNGTSLTSDRFGNTNSCYYFDGIDDGIIVTDNGALSTPAFSLCYYLNTEIIKHQMCIGKIEYNNGNGSTYNSAILDGSSNFKNYFTITDNNSPCQQQIPGTFSFSIFSPTTIQTNQWYCIVNTFSNGVQRIYLNGLLVLEENRTFTQAKNCTNTNFLIGTWWASDKKTFKGKIDDVRYYNRAINQAEVNALCTTTIANSSTIINDYAAVINFNKCTNKLTVDDAGKYKAGDTVLLIQIKGADIETGNTATFGNIISYNNAGNYEFNYVKNKVGNEIELKNVLVKNYDFAIGKVQLVRVPYFNTAIINDTITCLPWDGTKGGIVVLKAATSIELNAPINVSEKGFRGGKFGNGFACNSTDWAVSEGFNGSKGEGITNNILGFEAGGAKIANGGGGSFAGNTGSGGGSNGGIGGTGGKEYDGCNALRQSIGGQALDYTTASKLYFGGGGGGGAQDNGALILNGGNGGGIVIIQAPTFKGNGQKIMANGENISIIINDEGGTGGGGGGAVLLFCDTYTGSIIVETNGGNGSSNNNIIFPNNCHGPGGGGGGGYLGVSNNALPNNITLNSIGGKAGKVLNPSSACFNTTHGALDGDVGLAKINAPIPISTIPFKKNIDSLKIIDTITQCTTLKVNGFAINNTPLPISFSWNFGDNTTANTQIATHNYAQQGTYTVTLKVTASNGCTDSIVKQINITNTNFDFTLQQDICNPLHVTYKSSDTLLNMYSWTVGDNSTTQSTATINHVYADTGTYVVTLSIPNGCVDSVKKTIHIGYQKNNIIITNDTTICNGNSVVLKSDIDSTLNFCWSPLTYLNNGLLANPTSTPAANIKYILHGIKNTNNLIINGNFNSGNTSFTSDYIVSPTAPSINTNGQFLVTNSSLNITPSSADCKDHTTLNGNMLIVKSNNISNEKVWSQKVVIQKNTNYIFSTWIQALQPNSKTKLAFNINGVTFIDSLQTSFNTCMWQRKSIVWNAGNIDTAIFSIVNNNTINGGDVFALDDIELSNFIINKDSVQIAINNPAIQTINDTSICRGTQITLTTNGAKIYKWSPVIGISDSTIFNPIASPTDTTTYIVSGINIFGCTAFDTVTINIKPSPIIVKSNDTIICKNATVQLFVSGADTYKWSPGTTLNKDTIANPLATPLTNTTYYISSTNANLQCIATDSIKVTIKSAALFSVAPVDTVCAKTTVQLQAFGGDIYKWSPINLLNNDSISNPIATPKVNTKFFVTIKDSVCKTTAILSTMAIVKPSPTLAITKSNDIDCYNVNAKLNVSGAAIYNWFASEPPLYLSDSIGTNAIAYPSLTKKYFITGKDTFTHCENTDSIVVFVYLSGNPEFWIPNAFSPNRDRKNDCWKVYPQGRLLYFEMAIYNRWGQLVFKTEDINECWNGTFKGQPQDPGNFVYRIKAKNLCKENSYSGNLLLIR